MNVTPQQIKTINAEFVRQPLGEGECRYISLLGLSVAHADTTVADGRLITEIKIGGVSYKFYYHASA